MFYLSQILMVAFALFIGHKEATAVRVMRELPYGNPYEEPFHFYGFGASFIFSFTLILFQQSIPAFIITPFLCGVIYWSVFEYVLNKEAFGKWNYIGRTAKTDKAMWQLFGATAERDLVILKVTLFIVLNALYLIL